MCLRKQWRVKIRFASSRGRLCENTLLKKSCPKFLPTMDLKKLSEILGILYRTFGIVIKFKLTRVEISRLHVSPVNTIYRGGNLDARTDICSDNLFGTVLNYHARRALARLTRIIIFNEIFARNILLLKVRVLIFVKSDTVWEFFLDKSNICNVYLLLVRVKKTYLECFFFCR